MSEGRTVPELLELSLPVQATDETVVYRSGGVLKRADMSDVRTYMQSNLGTMAVQNASAVAITGGSITGIVDLAVADGGTGASNAGAARTNLGVTIGTDVQAYNARLQDISANLTATSGTVEKTGADTFGAYTVTTAGKALLDDADAAAQRTTLGLGTAAVANIGDAAGNVVNADVSTLTAATDVQDGDLLASYRSPGPLKKLTAALYADYIKAFFASSGGAALVGFNQSGTNPSSSTVAAEVRRIAKIPEQYGALGDGSTNDVTALTNCFAAAVAAGVPVFLQPGKNYRCNTAPTVPAGLVLYGYGATISTAASIILFDVTAAVTILGVTLVGPQTTYNAGQTAVRIQGTRNGAGVAPTMVSGVYFRDVQIRNFGNYAVDAVYIENSFFEGMTIENCGYAGVFVFSGRRVGVVNCTIDGLVGETGSGQLNAYGITFTSQANPTDLVRDPRSVDCWAASCVVKNVPTWHAYDTHGGDTILFLDCVSLDCAKAFVITSLGTAGALDCVVQGCHASNSLTGQNSNGTGKQDSAFWDIGGSALAKNLRTRITHNTVYQHGDEYVTSGAAYIEHAEDGTFAYNSLRNPNNFAMRLAGDINRYAISYNDIWDVKGFGIAGGGPTDNPVYIIATGTDLYNIKITNNQFFRANTSAGTVVGVVGLILPNTALKSFHLEGNTFNGITQNFSIPDFTGVTGDLIGTYTGTLTGLTTSPTRTVKYVKSRRIVTLSIDTATTGTSNTTALTITGMPAPLFPSASKAVVVRVTDNGVNEFGVMFVGTDGVLSFFRAASLNAFTSSGTKGVQPFSISYEAGN